MLTDTERDNLNNAMRVNRIIWFCMIGSVVIYAVIANVLESQLHGIQDVGETYIMLEKIFFGVSIVVLIATRYLRKVLLAPPSKGRSNQQAPATARYTTAMIVSLALAESIAIYGVILFILGGSFQTLYAFCIISAIAMVYFRPKMEELEKLAEAMKGSGPSI